jgi:hypothetical protein
MNGNAPRSASARAGSLANLLFEPPNYLIDDLVHLPLR